MTIIIPSVAQYLDFAFLEPGELSDGQLRLVLERGAPADTAKGWVPCYHFKLCLKGSDTKIGNLDFRAGETRDLLMYGGHFGYGVYPEYRGQHFAERACRLLLPFVARHEMTEIWITCNPENFASRRTCERLGAELVEIVEIPPHIDMYREGGRQKCRYRLKLPRNL